MQAKVIMEQAVSKYKDQAQSEGQKTRWKSKKAFFTLNFPDLNLLLDLMLQLGLNEEALEVMCEYCFAQFSSEKVKLHQGCLLSFKMYI